MSVVLNWPPKDGGLFSLLWVADSPCLNRLHMFTNFRPVLFVQANYGFINVFGNKEFHPYLEGRSPPSVDFGKRNHKRPLTTLNYGQFFGSADAQFITWLNALEEYFKTSVLKVVLIPLQAECVFVTVRGAPPWLPGWVTSLLPPCRGWQVGVA